MHIISKRAAVAIDSASNIPSHEPVFPIHPTPSTAIKTLWASKSLPVPGGRVVAVRMNSGLVEVGIIDNDTGILRWKPAAAAMSGAQQRQWMREAKFVGR